jgi:hypothetical protein
VEIDGLEKTGTIASDGSWMVTLKAPSKKGTCALSVTSGDISSEASIEVSRNGEVTDGAEDSRITDYIMVGLILLLFLALIVALFRRRSEKGTA